jgi:hypothetical protein
VAELKARVQELEASAANAEAGEVRGAGELGDAFTMPVTDAMTRSFVKEQAQQVPATQKPAATPAGGCRAPLRTWLSKA